MRNNDIRWGDMFAITFDMDTEILAELYHQVSYNNAYADIARYLVPYKLSRAGSMRPTRVENQSNLF